MRTERFQYTIPVSGSASGSEVDITFTYNETAPNSDGTFTALTASGTYKILRTDGTSRTSTITGLIAPNGYAGNDNKLYLNSSPLLNGVGVSYTISNNGDGNNGGNSVNLFGQSGPDYYENGSNVTEASSFTATNACFCTGTLIRTERGDVAVEDLIVGDVAITRDGRRKMIRWIGHRHLRCNQQPEPHLVHPVRVKAGTFGDGLPYADLWLSRNHALYFDNCLVPVRGLIDDASIARVPQDEVTYWHVELDGHDVLLANGLPAESYLDTGNRRAFDDADATLLHFDDVPSPGYDGSGYCLTMVESGPLLSAIRARYGLGRVAARAEQADGAVHLVADGATIVPLAASDNELRFLVPAGVSELRLVSPSFSAAGADVRRLGVIVGGLAVSDGAGWQEVPLDATGLYAGFHALERGAGKSWRWTDGEAHLAPSLWAAFIGAVLLRLTGVFAGLCPAEPADARETDEVLRAA